jgi:hypothetical protein
VSDPELPASGIWPKRLAEYREKFLQALFLGLPTLVLGKAFESLYRGAFGQPWHAIGFLAAIAAVAWILHRGLASGTRFYPGPRLLAFLGAYLLVFGAAAGSSFLDFSRELTAFGEPASRRWLTPVRWGDWRYRLVSRKVDPREELIVVLLRPAAGRAVVDSRKEIADLVAVASRSGAKGLALDAYFEQSSPIDRLLCHTISTAKMPVLAGFGFEKSRGIISELGMPDTLARCLPPERQAHLAGVLDFDKRSRLSPLFFRGDLDRPSLGLAVARALSGQRPVALPGDGLVRYIPPPADPPTVRLEELQRDRRTANLLRNRFVLAGEERDRDSFNTPFGRKHGVLIHAYVAHSLRQEHYFHRQPWWLGLGFTLVFGYWMTLWCAAGVPARTIAMLAGVATVVILATAVGGVLVGPYWLDVVYPLAAIWLLVPLLVGLRRRMWVAAPATPAPAPSPAAV